MRNARHCRHGGGLLAGVLSIAAAGCGRLAPEPEAKGSTTARPVPVTVAPLERRTVERTVEALGTLRGWEQVTIGSKRTGRVIKVHHDMGDRVEPGDPLVDLESTDARLAIEEAESRYLGALVKLGVTRQQAEEFIQRYGISEELLNGRVTEATITKVPAVVEKRVAREKAQHSLARQRALTQRGAGTTQELEDADHQYRTAVAAYDNALYTARTIIADTVVAKVALGKAEQTLKDLTIRAPLPSLLPPDSGRTSSRPVSYGLTRRQVAEGQMIKEGEAVVELVIEDPLRLWTQVPEQFVDDVRVGQAVRVSARSHPDMTFDGRVARISPSVDPSNRTFQVETLVPNRRGLLRPGGLARASIVTEAQAQAAVVPVEAIVRFAGVTKLFIVERGRARAINDIQTGKEGRGWVEVLSRQLPPAADVVTTGLSQLADGTPVVIRQPAS
jgi:RND family efflux transporter MFP subunit